MGSSPQPQIIASLNNNTLVFTGLLVAGTVTLVASGSLQQAPRWVSYVTIASVVLALAGGICCLLSNLNAHNLSRRTEKSYSDVERKKREIASARWWSIEFATYAFWLTLAATCAVSAAIIAWVVLTGPGSSGSRDVRTISIISKSGKSDLKLIGTVENFELEELKDGCRVKIVTPNVTIEAVGQDHCTQLKQR